MPMAQGRALVVGGGVAGLATAAQLAREGMEVGGCAAKKWGILPANMGISCWISWDFMGLNAFEGKTGAT